MKILCLLFVLLFSVAVQADVLCVKKRVPVTNGMVRLMNNVRVYNNPSCPARYALVKDLATIKDRQLAAFARISADGTVLSYGGATVSGVSAFEERAGTWEVTFTGDFALPDVEDSETNRLLFTANSTAVADNYGVTNNGVHYASQTQVRVTVFLWRSDSLTDDSQAGVNLSLFLGRVP